MMNDITKYVSFLLNTQDCSLILLPAFSITVAITLPTDWAGFPSQVVFWCLVGAQEAKRFYGRKHQPTSV
jgi:hypothetical protein